MLKLIALETPVGHCTHGLWDDVRLRWANYGALEATPDPEDCFSYSVRYVALDVPHRVQAAADRPVFVKRQRRKRAAA